MRRSLMVFWFAFGIAAPECVLSQTVDAVSEVAIDTVDPALRYALIVVGLPGDKEHHEKFNAILETWPHWLREVAGVAEQNIMIIGYRESDATSATSESIRWHVARLKEQLSPEDSLWVFLLGHGSQDDRHGWFHLPGPDMTAAEWAGLFAPIKAKEQIFWLTYAASGRFLKPLSRPGRVVISASDDGEVNETQFPYALTEIMREQLESKSDSEPLDVGPSVLDLFRKTAGQVDQFFHERNLVPTEHAQLDDNGDGIGTEAANLTVSHDIAGGEAAAVIDGAVSDRIEITLTPVKMQAKSKI